MNVVGIGSQLITKDITTDGRYDLLTEKEREALEIVKKIRA
jgi:2-keto-3-deoxy-6-phosphogluconate aldolase